MKKRFFLLLILVTTIFFRFYGLDKVPPSASLDEASIGYNAFSILKTGADEYDTKFPILLRAYDDWRPALYVYLVIPFVKIFGLSVLTVRLPSAILSVLTIVAVYFFVKELFEKDIIRHDEFNSASSSGGILKQVQDDKVALLTIFLLAISPWHIYISRLGHEVNAGLAFFIFAMFFSFYKKISLAAIFFILSFISYQSEKIFIPLMILGMGIVYRKELLNQWKKIILISFLSFIFLMPFIKETLQPNALIRFKGTSILEAKKEELAGKTGLERRFLMGQIIIKNYLLHFNPQWLFTNSAAESHKVPNLGLFYLWEALFMVIGFLWVIRHIRERQNQLLLFWLLIGPFPAALTTQAPHAMRTLQVLPVPQILTAVGLVLSYQFINSKLQLKSKNLFKKTILLLFLIIISSLSSLYKNYFIVFPKEQSKSFQYALKDTIGYVNQYKNEYRKIVFSNQEDLYQSYMFFLFYSRYDPKLYQQQGGTKSGGFAEIHQFGKFEFRPINENQEKKEAKILYVGTLKELSGNYLRQFNYLDENGGVRITNGQNL